MASKRRSSLDVSNEVAATVPVVTAAEAYLGVKESQLQQRRREHEQKIAELQQQCQELDRLMEQARRDKQAQREAAQKRAVRDALHSNELGVMVMRIQVWYGIT